jgi:hypothetical protein
MPVDPLAELGNRTGIKPFYVAFILEASIYHLSHTYCTITLYAALSHLVLAELGNRTGIKPFYVAFILGPPASTSSELIATVNYASKKVTR